MTVLLELALQATYAGQEIINRWNYLGTGTPAEANAAAALLQAFGCIIDGGEYPAGLPFHDMLLLQSSELTYQFATARDVYSETDFAEVPFVPNAAGLYGFSNPSNSPAEAFGFRTNRIVANIRRGTKRLAGVAAAAVVDKGVIAGSAQTLMLDIAEAWSAILTQELGGNSFTFTPVIVSKQRYNPGTGLPDPDGSAYRYYPTYDDQSEHWAAGPTWEPYTQVRTQTSRQYGKGR